MNTHPEKRNTHTHTAARQFNKYFFYCELITLSLRHINTDNPISSLQLELHSVAMCFFTATQDWKSAIMCSSPIRQHIHQKQKWFFFFFNFSSFPFKTKSLFRCRDTTAVSQRSPFPLNPGVSVQHRRSEKSYTSTLGWVTWDRTEL